MASRLEIADALESLATHCRPPVMSSDERSRWLADWCSDLAEFPAESVQTACQRWRMGTNHKFPMPGQFLPLVRSVTVRGPDTGPNAKAWGPVSDEEYATFSLRDKIRHQTILQSEAYRKAGPQWSNGARVPADEMPETWHTWRRIAEGHGAEAKRLLEKLKDAREDQAA